MIGKRLIEMFLQKASSTEVLELKYRRIFYELFEGKTIRIKGVYNLNMIAEFVLYTFSILNF